MYFQKDQDRIWGTYRDAMHVVSAPISATEALLALTAVPSLVFVRGGPVYGRRYNRSIC